MKPGARPAAAPGAPPAGRPRGALALLAMLALAKLALGAAPQPSPPPAGPHDATAHERFAGVERWSRIFDDPQRDEWQKPKELVAALGLLPGNIVADPVHQKLYAATLSGAQAIVSSCDANGQNCEEHTAGTGKGDLANG